MKESYSKKEVINMLKKQKQNHIKILKDYQRTGNGPDYSYDGFSTYDDGYKRGIDNCIEAVQEMGKELSCNS